MGPGQLARNRASQAAPLPAAPCPAATRLCAMPPPPRRCSAVGEGVEYLLADSQPPHLFILRKLYRHAGGAITTLAFYYILDGSIYQAPSLQAALLARMVGGGGGGIWLGAVGWGVGWELSVRSASGQALLGLHASGGCCRRRHPRARAPALRAHVPQQRCMFSLKAAFRDMQRDLAPLSLGAWCRVCSCACHTMQAGSACQPCMLPPLRHRLLPHPPLQPPANSTSRALWSGSLRRGGRCGACSRRPTRSSSSGWRPTSGMCCARWGAWVGAFTLSVTVMGWWHGSDPELQNCCSKGAGEGGGGLPSAEQAAGRQRPNGWELLPNS